MFLVPRWGCWLGHVNWGHMATFLVSLGRWPPSCPWCPVLCARGVGTPRRGDGAGSDRSLSSSGCKCVGAGDTPPSPPQAAPWEGDGCPGSAQPLLSPLFPWQNVEKTLIRPMAFKPVVPKLRSTQPGTRPGLSESQVSLTHLLGAEKPGSLSCRASTLSDSGRNSLSSLPTYSTGCSQHPEASALPVTPHGPPEPPGGCRPSNSDSGRSSSSKSTGSLSGRGRPSSESGSCGRSPLPGEEAMLVRELEDKLREREAELRLLRDSLDENEVAICQVRPWCPPVLSRSPSPGHLVWTSPLVGGQRPLLGTLYRPLYRDAFFCGFGNGVFPSGGWSYVVPGGALCGPGGQL